MRFGHTIMSFVGLTAILLSAELWLRQGFAAQKVADCFCRPEI